MAAVDLLCLLHALLLPIGIQGMQRAHLLFNGRYLPNAIASSPCPARVVSTSSQTPGPRVT